MERSWEERNFKVFFSTQFTSPCITLTLSNDPRQDSSSERAPSSPYLRSPRDVSIPLRMRLEGSPDELVNGSNVPIIWGDRISAGEKCENLLWLRFLRSLGSITAAEIIDGLSRKEGPEYYHDVSTQNRADNLNLYDQVFFVAFLKAVSGHYTTELAKGPTRIVTTKLRIPLPLWVSSDVKRNLESFFQQDETFAQVIEFASTEHDILLHAAIGLRSEDVSVGDRFIVCHMEEETTSVAQFRAMASDRLFLELEPRSDSKIALVGYSDFGQPFVQYLRAKLSRRSRNLGLDPALVYSRAKAMQGTFLFECLPSVEATEYYDFVCPWIPDDHEDRDEKKLRINSWVINRFFLRTTLKDIASEVVKLISNEKAQIRVVLSGVFGFCHRVSACLQILLRDSFEDLTEELEFVTIQPERNPTSLLPCRVILNPSNHGPTPVAEFEKPSIDRLEIRLRSLKNIFTRLAASNADTLTSGLQDLQRVKWDLELLLIESSNRHGISCPTRDIITFAIALYTHLKVPSEVKRIARQFIEGYESAMSISQTSPSKYGNAQKFQAMHFASSHGDLECLKILIAAGASVLQPVSDESFGDFTPLVLAVSAGQVPAVAFLLKNGAPPNTQISDGRTALHFCSENPDSKLASEMAALLISANPKRAFIETKDKKRKTAKDIAKINRLESLGSFFSRETQRVLLLESIATGKCNSVQKLASIDNSLFVDVEEGLAAMHLAARSNQGTILELLHKTGFQISPRSQTGHTPLHLAAKEGHIEIIGLLERLGADKSDIDNSGNNALHLAAMNGKDQVVSLLLRQGMNPSLQNDEGNSVLHLAAYAGHQSTVSTILKFGYSGKGGGKQRQNLMELALPQERALEEELMMIPQQTISVASQSYQMATETSQLTHTTVSRQTLHSQPSSSMDVSLQHQSRTLAIEKTRKQTAQKGFQAQLVPRFQPRDQDVLSVSQVASQVMRHPEISHGQWQDFIESNNTGGQSSLDLAVESDHLGIVKILLENGAKVSSDNSKRRGPFHIVAAVGSLGVLEILLKSIHRTERHLKESSSASEGNKESVLAHLTALDENGWTPLHFAADNGHDRVVNRLIQVCPTLAKHTHSQYCQGWTPLELACKHGYLSIVEHLLQASADINTCPKNGNSRTALQVAAEGGHLEVVQLLLKAGAEVNSGPEKFDGLSPLQAAASGGHLEVVCALLASGACVSAPAAEAGGRTALQAAEESGDIETLEQVLTAIRQDAGPFIVSKSDHFDETSSNSRCIVKTSMLASVVEIDSSGETSKEATEEATLGASQMAASTATITSLPESDREMHLQADEQGAQHDNRESLVIAIEYGVEFSRVCYLITEMNLRDPFCIYNWPGLGSLSPKVPSIIEYDSLAPNSFKWGYEVKKDSLNSIKHLSHNMDHDGYSSFGVHRLIENNLNTIERQGKSLVGVAHDYLGALYNHTYKSFQEEFPIDYFRSLRVEVILTVPDLISDQDKENFYKAAKFTGADSVTLISRADAAANYVNNSTDCMSGCWNEDEEGFVICDVGNRDTDVYTFRKTTPGNYIAQLWPFQRSIVGSETLDERFTVHIEKAIGYEAFYSIRGTWAWSDALSRFQREIKCAFEGEKSKKWNVFFPMAGLADDEPNGLKNNCLTLNCEMVQAIFEPVTIGLGNLIQEQIDMVETEILAGKLSTVHSIKKIFLIGECAKLPYVKLQIQDRFPDIQVVQFPDAEKAIVLGTAIAMSQIPPEAEITSTIAVRHYGVIVENNSDVNEDAGQRSGNRDRGQSSVKPKMGQRLHSFLKRANSRYRSQKGSPIKPNMDLKMYWFLEREQEISADKIRLQCRETVENLNNALVQHASFGDIAVSFAEPKLRKHIICSDEDEAPEYYTSDLASINCILEIDLANWSKRHLLASLRVGHSLTIDYTLIIVLKDASMRFWCKIDDEMMEVTPHYE